MSGSFLLSDRLEKYIYEFGVNETKIEKELRLHSLKEHSTTFHLQIMISKELCYTGRW